ncbi:UPF0158 family protein [Pseudonocardia charpentierae]|uniref:UPF0158 family protein n=1 Tax=Pseudonocardia charpentierae TaxID=3075545 RepID=A0ABU2N2H4_9PSEU|nr:UPF0158 family protein [Pseudonocardia sp. DSM 45834]MDT0348112.1 UPF0158 family protein [Pseudonocardia sp. DSM 45834]
MKLLWTEGDVPWQLAGDGVATALSQHVDGAGPLAVDCIASLRDRDWIGDAELADQLDGLAGTGPTPLLRPLPVNLEELSEILEGDPLTAGGALDLRTGEVWTRPAVEYAQEDGVDVETPDFDDADRFRWVDGDSRDGYRDMADFIVTLPDQRLGDRLNDAIRGRGAFRRFADTLDRESEDELTRWFEFAGERKRGRARAWLADVGYRVVSGHTLR